MTTSKSYEVSLEHIDVKSELHRLHNLANQNWEKEARNLKEFGLQDGMSILEVGSGPGFVTELLSSLVPNGSIISVEIDPDLIKYSEQYLKDKASSQYRIVEGSVMDMDFPDNTFDFVVARLLIRHLPDPIGAVKEIFRVLKPGGKLAITEFDYGIPPISDPDVPEGELIREKAMYAHKARGGDPLMGRKLWRVLKASGFQKFDLEAVVFHSGKKGIEWCYPQFDPDRALPLVKEGVISEAEMQSFRTAVERFMSSEDPFFLWVILMSCGEKP
ncbi:MAG: methyltransferase domain-containing protein [Nostoc sp. NMS7]|uniref:class I SAM-dependent methyltransferase n=1 Tax=Nostoc sp. NMS7 TaxID=2815391 RepID=UPI0025D5471B|nr:methyltransferase domain-containing protein [Nostoc sp. NMS7]MBN3950375.1 methyltransferase domain-containing protein [Nostoc sp. NMS7]